MDIASWRKKYMDSSKPFFVESSLPTRDPLTLFDLWFREMASMRDLVYEEVNSVSVSTVSEDGRPSSRMVLLKAYDEKGFSFFTNYDSRKGRQIAGNPNAAMLFFWPRMTRQVRVEGVMEKLPVAAAEEYWASRPIASRISGTASQQSRVIPNREHLEKRQKELEEEAAAKGEGAIGKPPTWGGFILRPSYFEFWQGQTDRLHDRIIFSKEKPSEGAEWVEETPAGWFMYRLAP